MLKFLSVFGHGPTKLGGGHWDLLETAKPKKKSSKTAKKIQPKRKPHTKPSKTDTIINGDKWGIQSKVH